MVLLEILQNSQENTCARVSFLIKLQEHRGAAASILSHLNPLVPHVHLKVTHTYLTKPAAESYKFVKVCATF